MLFCISETLNVSLQTLVYGVSIVIAVLALLIVVVKILEAIAKPRTSRVVEKIVEPKNLLESNDEDDQKICAAISAAVIMMMSSDQIANTLDFKVRSIKRI